jgi:hypothetical protein
MPTVLRTSALVLPVIVLALFSRIPWTFTYLEVGKLTSPFPFLDIIFLILFVAATTFALSLASRKLKEKKAVWLLALSIILLSLIIFSFSMFFMPQVSLADKKISTFVSDNENLSFEDYVLKASMFLNENVGSAWAKPESVFKIDNWLSSSLLDLYIMRVWGATRADLILYQGWGTCGQAALLLEELFQRAGYETRDAAFASRNHQWAEVRHNGTWWMVDPWYIGSLTHPLVQPQNLRNLNSAFQKESGVDVQYVNGTIADASSEHGY